MLTKKGNASLIILIILVCLLSATTAYFFLQSQDKPVSKSKQNNKTDQKETKQEEKESEAASTTTTPKNTQTPPSNPDIKPAPAGTKPSNPAETYTVQDGETLFAIGHKLNINWLTLAAINNMSNADVVKSGDLLIIPTLDESTKKLYINFQADTTRATALQNEAASKPNSVYLDPVATAKQDTVPVYSLTANDSYTLESNNEYEGTAVVSVTHEDKKYQINLIQPANKGKGGIWAIAKIVPQ